MGSGLEQQSPCGAGQCKGPWGRRGALVGGSWGSAPQADCHRGGVRLELGDAYKLEFGNAYKSEFCGKSPS